MSSPTSRSAWPALDAWKNPRLSVCNALRLGFATAALRQKIVATSLEKGDRLAALMKRTSSRFFVKAALGLGLIVPWVAQGQSDSNVPEINFQTVPITTAIENLARLAGVNHLVDPKLFAAADGTMKPEPVLTLRWENYTAANALARVLKENHLFMVTNDFTTVILITAAKTISHTVDAKLLGSTTNGVIPIIKFSDVPLGEALKNLINQAHLSVILDPHVTGDAPPEPPNFKMEMQPQVSVNWHDLTARQAIVELCEDYGLTIVKGTASNMVEIKPKK